MVYTPFREEELDGRKLTRRPKSPLLVPNPSSRKLARQGLLDEQSETRGYKTTKQPIKMKINFGKYNGANVLEIAKIDPNYIQWCLENVKGFRESYSMVKKPTKQKSSCNNGFSEVGNVSFKPPGAKIFKSRRPSPANRSSGQ
jgi:hypothetical protein